MSWIKRNIYFVAGSVVALVLLVVAGLYAFSKYDMDRKSWETLNGAYEELRQLGTQKPNPGNEKIDNVKIARAQQVQLTAEMQKVVKHFAAIPAIPDNPNVSDQDFATALRQTLSSLQRDANTASVTLQPDYSFSFSAQRRLVKFSAGSTHALARQLGEVKQLSDVLITAKVNSLDSLRRERLSEDDLQGPLNDYLDEKSKTNDLAVVTPYEVTFRCFSTELAGVLAGLANQSHALVVRSINVEQPGASTMAATAMMMNPNVNNYAEVTGGGNVYTTGFNPNRPNPNLPGGVPAAGPPVARRGGLPIVLDEKAIRVTMLVDVIKLLPKK